MMNSLKIFTAFEKKLEMTIVKCLSGVLIALTIGLDFRKTSITIQKFWATRQVMISNLALYQYEVQYMHVVT